MPVYLTLFAVVVVIGLYAAYLRSLQPVSQNNLSNGSFEDDKKQPKYLPDSGRIQGSVTWMKLSNGATTIPNWEVVGTIGWDGSDDSGEFGPWDARFFLDLRNNNPNAGFGGVKQDLWLKKDTDYEVSVFVGTSPPKNPGPVTITVEIDNFGGRTHSLPPQTANPPGAGRTWTKVRWRFDTAGWNEMTAGVGVTITIGAQSGANAGKRFVGLDQASLVELRGGIFSRVFR